MLFLAETACTYKQSNEESTLHLHCFEVTRLRVKILAQTDTHRK